MNYLVVILKPSVWEWCDSDVMNVDIWKLYLYFYDTSENRQVICDDKYF